MLSAVVPCYNEEKNLPLLADSFEKALRAEISKNDFELILVNNGSTDNSKQVLEKIAKEYKFVRLAVVQKNIGYGHGIMTGLKAAKGDVLAFTHADLQCDPCDVARAYDIFQKSENKRILVKGNRKGRFSVLTAFFHLISDVLFLRHFNDINGQPKLFSKDILQAFKNPPKGFHLDFYIQYKAKKHGYKIVSFPVKFGVRKYGYSKWATSIKSRIKNVARFLGYILKVRFLGE